MNMRVFYDVIIVVFTFVVCALESSGQNFTIIRSRSPNFNNKDYFNVELRPSVRQTAPCSFFGGSKTSSNPLRCVCDLTNKPTFGQFNGKWQCFDDTAVRSSQGCKAQLYDRYILKTYSSAILILRDLASFEQFKSKQLLRCNVLNFYTQYHMCNGSWSTPVDAVNKFFISGKGFMGIFFLEEIYQLGKEFGGRLIKLSIECQSWNGLLLEDCLIFKIPGNTTCKGSPITTIQPPPASTSVHRATKSSSFSPVLPNNGSIPAGNDGGSTQTSKRNSVGAIVGAVVAMLVVVIGAVVTVLILKRKGKFGQRTKDLLKERPENPSNVRAEVSRDAAQSQEGPQSPLYAVIGRKISKKLSNSADGIEYPEYARVVKSQVSQQSNQSVGYDYAFSEAPTSKKNNLPLPNILERCPEHGSTVSIASLRSISKNSEDVHDGDDNGDDDDDDDSGGYEYLVEGQECVEHNQTVDDYSASNDNDGYELPVVCSVKEKQRALLELLASQTSNEENNLINNLLSSTKSSSTTKVDENPEQGVYSVLETDALNQEHVYQALIDTCDVYAPLQNTEATPPSLPSEQDSLEHEFGETPI